MQSHSLPYQILCFSHTDLFIIIFISYMLLLKKKEQILILSTLSGIHADNFVYCIHLLNFSLNFTSFTTHFSRCLPPFPIFFPFQLVSLVFFFRICCSDVNYGCHLHCHLSISPHSVWHSCCNSLICLRQFWLCETAADVLSIDKMFLVELKQAYIVEQF